MLAESRQAGQRTYGYRAKTYPARSEGFSSALQAVLRVGSVVEQQFEPKAPRSPELALGPVLPAVVHRAKSRRSPLTLVWPANPVRRWHADKDTKWWPQPKRWWMNA